MPYDDSNIKKMIKTQTERKVGFSRNRRLSENLKNLIHCMLEADINRRYSIASVKIHPWMQIYEATIPRAVPQRQRTPPGPSAPRTTSSLIPHAGHTPATTTTTQHRPLSPPRVVVREIQTAVPRTEPTSRARSPSTSNQPRNLPPLKQDQLPPKRILVRRSTNTHLKHVS